MAEVGYFYYLIYLSAAYNFEIIASRSSKILACPNLNPEEPLVYRKYLSFVVLLSSTVTVLTNQTVQVYFLQSFRLFSFLQR